MCLLTPTGCTLNRIHGVITILCGTESSTLIHSTNTCSKFDSFEHVYYILFSHFLLQPPVFVPSYILPTHMHTPSTYIYVCIHSPSRVLLIHFTSPTCTFFFFSLLHPQTISGTRSSRHLGYKLLSIGTKYPLTDLLTHHHRPIFIFVCIYIFIYRRK